MPRRSPPAEQKVRTQRAPYYVRGLHGLDFVEARHIVPQWKTETSRMCLRWSPGSQPGWFGCSALVWGRQKISKRLKEKLKLIQAQRLQLLLKYIWIKKKKNVEYCRECPPGPCVPNKIHIRLKEKLCWLANSRVIIKVTWVTKRPELKYLASDMMKVAELNPNKQAFFTVWIHYPNKNHCPVDNFELLKR